MPAGIYRPFSELFGGRPGDGDIASLARAAARADYAVLAIRPGTKRPLCALTSRQRAAEDKKAAEAARDAGRRNWERVRHPCGITHATSDPVVAHRVFKRAQEDHEHPVNIALDVYRSRLLVADADTAAELASFTALWAAEERQPALVSAAPTVRSPGEIGPDGRWRHSEGGHFHFLLDDGVELGELNGTLSIPIGADPEHQSQLKVAGYVLVPPSVRPEGAYVMASDAHPAPAWLVERVQLYLTERRVTRQHRADQCLDTGDTLTLEQAALSWSSVLEPRGWSLSYKIDRCGCETYTAPGDHSDPKSATAHDPGCGQFDTSDGFLHVWTDNPPDGMRESGARTFSKIQTVAWLDFGGDMGAAMRELGLSRERAAGPTVLTKTTLTTWDGVTEDTGHGDDPDKDRATEDGDPEVIERTEDIDYNERMIRQEMARELRRRAALERIAALDVPPLRMLVGPEFLTAPRPVQLVPRMLYRDSLARMFGDPGCGKSFLALDIALSIVLGGFWGGARMRAEPVIYVMAEGQAVNGDRAEAWLSRNGIDPSALADRLYVVPDAVMMTETAAAPFVRKVAEVAPTLVILDTKNAMMVGEENSATDFAALRRVMDQVRAASDCCVLLVDHTGYEGTRARGSSAATAGMDIEIRVTKIDDEKPSLVMAEVTRDKAAEPGATWAWRLEPEHPAAVLVKADAPERRVDTPDWLTDNSRLPDAIVDYEGQGAKAVESLARYMRLSTRLATGEQDRVGRNLADARADLKGVFDRDTVGRAWSAIKSMGFLESVYTDPTETQQKRGPHVWRVPQ